MSLYKTKQSNSGKADQASAALDEFVQQSGLELDSVQAQVADLIANFGHLCDREEIDFEQTVRTGLMNWNHER